MAKMLKTGWHLKKWNNIQYKEIICRRNIFTFTECRRPPLLQTDPLIHPPSCVVAVWEPAALLLSQGAAFRSQWGVKDVLTASFTPLCLNAAGSSWVQFTASCHVRSPSSFHRSVELQAQCRVDTHWCSHWLSPSWCAWLSLCQNQNEGEFWVNCRWKSHYKEIKIKYLFVVWFHRCSLKWWALGGALPPLRLHVSSVASHFLFSSSS